MFSMPARIRRARNVAKLSQAQLANQLGIQRSAVAQWEQLRGTSPNIDHLVQLAVVTGMCFEWLATGRGQARPGEGEFEQVATARDFAQNEIESQVLESIRRLSVKRQKAACTILGLMSD